MERLLDIEELGVRLRKVDEMIWELAMRRMHIAGQVEKTKRQKGEVIFRPQTEDNRINDARNWAADRDLNPHFVESLMYLLINESCKVQLIQREGRNLDTREPQSEEEWYAQLRNNLLALTEQMADRYDDEYATGYFATEAYLSYERGLLLADIRGLPETGLMLDLGCATGRTSFALHEPFVRVVGYDISQHMQVRAGERAERLGIQSKISFEQVDLEDGIPLENTCASLVVMNLGTGSDVRNIRTVIGETLRVLRPGGRFFFSFYNRDALPYRWDFLPWELDLAASLNIHRDSLDVHTKDADGKKKIIPVYARAYTKDEVQTLFSQFGIDVELLTFPSVSAVLPNKLFANQPEMQRALVEIDKSLTDSSMGVYIIARGMKL